MADIAQLNVDPSLGNVVLRFQAERALPIQGVLSCRGTGHIDPTDMGDPSVIEWQLPAVSALYVAYGIILPLQSVWFAPAYSRQFLQANQLLQSNIANPKRFTTEQQDDGEWVGPPEAFRIVVQS